MTDDQRYAMWVEQLQLMARDVVALHHHRFIWRRVGEITQQANLPPSSFFDALGIWYGGWQMTALRRLVDRDARTLSLTRLLDEIAAHPHVMSRDRHVALWATPAGVWDERHGEENYAPFADASGERIDVAAVHADSRSASDAVVRIREYVNQRIAHRDLEPIAEVPTWGEINGAIDALGALVNKYANLLTASTWAQFEPVIQYDWEAPFRQAWLPAE